MKLKFWQGDGRWPGYKGTSILLTCGIAKAFLDNYWVFTSVPLTEEDASIISKSFYMALQLGFTSALYGGVGLSIDYLRSIYISETNELTRLVFK